MLNHVPAVLKPEQVAECRKLLDRPDWVDGRATAGFTAERDMGTEGAGSADTSIRDAINQGLIAGP